MKKSILFIGCLLFFLSCSSQYKNKHTPHVKTLDSLLLAKSYFKAKEVFKKNQTSLSGFHFLKYQAIIQNLFNLPENSSKSLDSLLNHYIHRIEPKEAKDLLETQLSNYIKLFDYKAADSITEVLLSEYKSVYESGEIWNVRNNGIIWKAVKNYPAQKTTFKDSSHIKLYKDRAGLKNLNITVDNKKYPFIFDTGANLSVIIESQAEKMNIDIINVKVSVNTITGQRVDAKIGVGKKLSINNIVFENIVFLVFPDKALFVPQIAYQIKGILGYPVLSAMKEVHFIDNKEVFVPQESQTNKSQNLAIKYLTPYINLELNDGKMYPFSFDTGAITTFLYRPYFLEKKKEIEDHHKLTKIKFAGGGGSMIVDGYKIPLDIFFNKQKVTLESVSVIPKAIEGTNEFEYGNLGQDFINQFKTMIINFEKMFVHFE